MRVFTNKSNLRSELPNPVVTLGTFDGVHLGHRKVLDKLINVGDKFNREVLVITYWPHPRTILSPENDIPKLLSTLENKIYLFEKLSIPNLLIIAFTKELAEKRHDEFVTELLVNTLNVHSVVVGYDHRFGKNRTGSFDYLSENSHSFNINVFEVAPFMLNNVPISSTKIRKALIDGHLDYANQMLGYHYFVEGKVIKGLKLGTKINFPTANIALDFAKQQLPKDGVYLVKTEFDNLSFFGMLNTGENPTVKGKGRSIEVHLFDFNGNIYGKKIKISFLKNLRQEKKFSSVDELKEQLLIDKQTSLEIINSNSF